MLSLSFLLVRWERLVLEAERTEDWGSEAGRAEVRIWCSSKQILHLHVHRVKISFIIRVYFQILQITKNINKTYSYSTVDYARHIAYKSTKTYTLVLYVILEHETKVASYVWKFYKLDWTMYTENTIHAVLESQLAQKLLEDFSH